MAESAPSSPKPLGMLGPVDTWIRRTAIFCAVFVVIKIGFLFFSHEWDHAYFKFEAWPGFFEAVGFLGFALLVLTGRMIVGWVRRPESYYDPELDVEAEGEGA